MNIYEKYCANKVVTYRDFGDNWSKYYYDNNGKLVKREDSKGNISNYE